MGEQSPTILRCVLYLRVSTEDQARRGFSLQEQLTMCRARAEAIADGLRRQGIAVSLELIEFEDAISGEILDRPALDQARQYVRTHHPQYFICLDPDRFARKLSLQLLVTEELEKNTKLEFVQHDYQETAEGRLFYQLRGAISEFEKAKILERTARGRRGKLKSGKLASHVPIYGYQFDNELGNLTVNEPEAVWVRQIFEWAAEGVGPSEIADRLNATGITAKRGGRWYRSSVRSILRNTTYIGKCRCNRYDWTGMETLRQLPKEKRKRTIRSRIRPEEEWVIIDVPPIVDSTLWSRVEGALVKRTKRSARGVLPLSGLLRCGLCGAHAHYVLHKEGTYMIRCQNRYPKNRDRREPVPKCSLPSVSAHIIERKVWDDVQGWLTDPEILLERLELQATTPDDSEDIGHIRHQIQTIQDQLTVLGKEQTETVRLLAAKKLNQTVGESLLAENNNRMESLEKTLDEAKARLIAREATIQQRAAIRDAVSNMQARLTAETGSVLAALHGFDDDQRRRLFCMAVSEVLIYPGRGHATIPNLALIGL